MTKHLPRVLIAGISSGSGKTTAVCAVLTLLKRRGIGVTSCKCGPDYIDPMFHESVSGIPSANLDPFFCNENLLRYLLAENGSELAVIEGVMGYYDGTGADGTDNSTYTVAERTDTPVILTVNAKGASTSLIAVIEGFLHFVPESRIRGVIFNNVTAMTYAKLKRQMEARFGVSVKAVGYIPRLPEECILGSRHLGLITASEIDDLQNKLEKIADLCADTIDMDAVSEIAGGGYPELYADRLEQNVNSRESVRQAIESGMPTIAECGGFQYLGSTLDGRKMCGALPHDSTNVGKLVRFGYVTLTSTVSGLFGEVGTDLCAHEFHYYDSTDNGNGFTAEKPNGRSFECVHYTDSLYAGYPHLFLPANLPAAGAFLRKCLTYKEKKL